jgi:hypothetical protein
MREVGPEQLGTPGGMEQMEYLVRLMLAEAAVLLPEPRLMGMMV